MAGEQTNWKMELPPNLPMPVFTSTEPWQSQRVGALAIYCSDGRWGDAFDEFCHRSLLIPRYDRFAVPGGPAFLASAGGEPPGRGARGQLEFLARVHGIERIVLIAHHGCAFCLERCGGNERDCLPAQIDDVKKAAQTLRGWFREIRTEGYLAMRSDNALSFHRLNL